MRPVARAWLLLAAGVLLAQAAWCLSVPAFRGLDEFDHAYRAVSVAHGEWLPSGQRARHGRGDLVRVPADLVAAAGPECRARPYTGHDNCAPVSVEPDGQVTVATGAARYEPLYYWLVGQVSKGAHGTTALYLMRAVSALVCAGFVLFSLVTLRRWARTDWPVVALGVSLTPVVLYSSIVVAPNALEILAGTSLWCALVGLGSPSTTRRTDRALLVSAVPGAMVLATLRSLGVGFLVLTVLVVAASLGGRRLRELWSDQRRTLIGCAAPVLASAIGGAAWVLMSGANRPEEHGNYPRALVGSLIQLPVWVLQTIGAAPGRTDPAPMGAYLGCGCVLLALTVAALRRGERRLRLAVQFVAVASLAGPLALTLLTYRDNGVIWQGRYGMAFSVGILALAGLALERADVARPRPAIVLAAVSAVSLGQLIAVLHVLAGQARVSPSVAAGLWSAPSPWLVGALMLAGCAMVAAAGTALTPRRTTQSARLDLPAQERVLG